MMGLPTNCELSQGREATLGGSSGPRVLNADRGEPSSTTPGNEAADHRAPNLSPKANSTRAQASPARQATTRVRGDRDNPSPARARASKTPPNRSPQKTHFSRR